MKHFKIQINAISAVSLFYFAQFFGVWRSFRFYFSQTTCQPASQPASAFFIVIIIIFFVSLISGHVFVSFRFVSFLETILCAMTIIRVVVETGWDGLFALVLVFGFGFGLVFGLGFEF